MRSVSNALEIKLYIWIYTPFIQDPDSKKDVSWHSFGNVATRRDLWQCDFVEKVSLEKKNATLLF